ncbi:MAG: 4Fe-4S binding protein [Thermoguttaceae bacterium]|jgi:NAD-dependent dihydropyrimidine dehydrogenase PreA subunit
MAAVVDKESCVGCGACVDACPCDALSTDEEGFAVVSDDCAGCGACVDACPTGAITIE